jgi:hypothetical protein
MMVDLHDGRGLPVLEIRLRHDGRPTHNSDERANGIDQVNFCMQYRHAKDRTDDRQTKKQKKTTRPARALATAAAQDD